MTEQRTSEAEAANLFTQTAYDAEHAREIRGDLASLSPEELVAGFEEAVKVVEGFVVAAEALSIPTYTLLADTARRANEALERARA
jgi:hypothetical protein